MSENTTSVVACEVCGAPSTYEVCDVNASGPYVAVCSDACADVVATHADDCDCTDCDNGENVDAIANAETFLHVLDADADANIIDTIQDADRVQHASIVGGTDDDPRVFVVTSNVYGQTLVFAFRTLNGARRYYDAVTTDYTTEDHR
jgi:hypothetical protein